MTSLSRRTSDLDVLRREMDRLFSSFSPATSSNESAPAWMPRADVVESEDAYHLSMDLPGVDRDAVDVSFDDGLLKISGQRDVQQEHRDGRFHRVERHYGSFFRSFQLGNDVDPDGIEASFDDGVLEVRIAKAEARKPRQISVQSRVEGSARPANGSSASNDHSSSQAETEADEPASAEAAS